MRRWLALGLLVTIAFTPTVPRAEDRTVRLHAAGSLKPALTELARNFTEATGVKVEATFGASGLLRERLEKGEPGDVFASADIGNPLALSRAGKAGPVVLFARNRLCALARPNLAVTSEALLDVMLDPTVKLGTSTPKADPSGDYAWEVFRRADAVRPGAGERLEAKALQLTGGRDSAAPPEGRNVYAWHLAEGHADLFLAYCTAGPQVVAELPGATFVPLPPELRTGADYGLTVLASADARAALPLVLYMLSPDGQAVLAKHGFAAPTLP